LQRLAIDSLRAGTSSDNPVKETCGLEKGNYTCPKKLRETAEGVAAPLSRSTGSSPLSTITCLTGNGSMYTVAP